MIRFDIIHDMAERIYSRTALERAVGQAAFGAWIKHNIGIETQNAAMGLPLWKEYDTPLESTDAGSISNTFEPVVPKGTSLKEYIENELQDDHGKATGLELGGSGSSLFAGFSAGFFKNTAGVTLVDGRDANQREQDRERNHTVITGDIVKPHFSMRVLLALNGQPDVVIERLEGALLMTPDDPFFMFENGDMWYILANTPSLMFWQYPPILFPLMPSWINKVNSAPGLEGQIHQPGLYGVLRLKKSEGASEELPHLSPREIDSLYKEHGHKVGWRSPLLTQVSRLGLCI